MLKYILTTLLIATAIYQPVEKLNIDQYLGKWYQVYQDLPDSTFEGKARCITADYGMLNDTTISVLNSEINSRDKVQQIKGIAFYEDGNSGGELTVKLANFPTAPYWVVDLGPVENDQYQYSIVSDDKKLSLFVLARDVEVFFKKYNEEVLEKLDNLGFNNVINKPIKTNQENCTYQSNN